MTKSPLSDNNFHFKTKFRSFDLAVSKYGSSVSVAWWGPKHWKYEIEEGCKMWVACQLDMELVEFLDKLDIGRNIKK